MSCLLLVCVSLLSAAALAQQGTRQCQRLAIPDLFLAGTNSTYNPAAVWQEGLGWWAFANHDVCHFKNCGPQGRNTRPMGMYLGSGLGPDTGLPRITANLWTVVVPKEVWVGSCNYTSDHVEACTSRAPEYSIVSEDFRPFMYQGSVWAALTLHPHPRSHQPEQGHRAVQAVATADFEQRVLRVQHVFFRTLSAGKKDEGAPLITAWEKNWGFFQYQNRTYILYSVMPCVTLLEFVPNGTALGFRFVQGRCFTRDGGAQLKALWKSKHPSFDARLSGHPQLWRGTLYAMAHMVLKPTNATFNDVKYYHHYLLKVDPATWIATHVSEAPVLSSFDYNISGPYKGALVVGSFHINQEGSRELVRMLFGEGDKYSCKDAVALADISWRPLDADNWGAPQPATDFFWQYTELQ